MRKNKFAELVPRFRSDLFDPKSQNHRNSETISRILRLRIGRRWPEDGMRKCEVIFAQALSKNLSAMDCLPHCDYTVVELDEGMHTGKAGIIRLIAQKQP